MNASQAGLRELLETSAHELFVAYGMFCEPTGMPAADEIQLCGVLGFTGADISGSVLISATTAVLTRSNPIPGSADHGWLAELTNQLVGRFKNELHRRAVDVAMSIPIVMSATRLVPIPGRPIAPIYLTVGPGTVSMWLELEGEVVLQEPQAAVLREGDWMEF